MFPKNRNKEQCKKAIFAMIGADCSRLHSEIWQEVKKLRERPAHLGGAYGSGQHIVNVERLYYELTPKFIKQAIEKISQSQLNYAVIFAEKDWDSIQARLVTAVNDTVLQFSGLGEHVTVQPIDVRDELQQIIGKHDAEIKRKNGEKHKRWMDTIRFIILLAGILLTIVLIILRLVPVTEILKALK